MEQIVGLNKNPLPCANNMGTLNDFTKFVKGKSVKFYHWKITQGKVTHEKRSLLRNKIPKEEKFMYANPIHSIWKQSRWRYFVFIVSIKTLYHCYSIKETIHMRKLAATTVSFNNIFLIHVKQNFRN